MMPREYYRQILTLAFEQYGVKNFDPNEFAPIQRDVPQHQNTLHIIPTAMVLQAIRDAGAGAVHINSAYRDPVYNKSVGGAPDSQHVHFRAADITTQNWTPDEVADWLEDRYGGYKLIAVGRYNTFTHIDTRHWMGNPEYGEGPARWDNRT